MKVAGVWVGLGPGDTDPKIRDFKAHLKRKYSWVRESPLDDGPNYTEQLAAVVKELQRRTWLPQTGILDYATQFRSGFITAPKVKPVLLTVCGTGVPWWIGPDADVARAVERKYRWQPVGYPATPFPMSQSVAAGRQELVAQCERWRQDIITAGCALIGYSQGAIVVSEAWMQDIRPDQGRLAWMRPHLKKVVTFGNPMREQGRAWSDGLPVPKPDSRGIADVLLTDTPGWWRDIAHAGDLYTDVRGEAAEYKTAIYKIIMGTRILSGPDSLLAQLAELGQAPTVEGIAMMQALLDAGMFFGARTGPHINYRTQPAVDYLMEA